MDGSVIDGWTWHEMVICASVLGLGGPAHGSPERWDWSNTARDLLEAQERHRRHERLRAQLTPEQRATVLRSETAKVAR